MQLHHVVCPHNLTLACLCTALKLCPLHQWLDGTSIDTSVGHAQIQHCEISLRYLPSLYHYVYLDNLHVPVIQTYIEDSGHELKSGVVNQSGCNENSLVLGFIVGHIIAICIALSIYERRFVVLHT